MRETTRNSYSENMLAVNSVELQKIIGAGRRTAVEIGTAAGAKIYVGRRVLWNVAKIRKYLDEISE